MSDLAKELLVFVGIFIIIAVLILVGRFGGKKNNEINDSKKDMDESELTPINSKNNKNNTNKKAK